MFVTEDHFLSAMTGLLSNPGQRTWLVGELMLNLPWFIVTVHELSPDEGGLVVERTVFASSILQAERWAEYEATFCLKFQSILIVTPSSHNNTGTWQMETLSSIWVAEDAAKPGIPIEICETKSGARYATSFCGTAPDKLSNYKLRYQFEG